jgi:heme/copper-type cytochrome/quinol oxidase subunit 2
VTEGINYELTFPLRYRANFSENTAFEEVKTDGQTISCISYNKILSVRSTAVKYNIQGIVILLLWAISFVICAIIVFIDFTQILRFMQRKDTGEEAQQLLHGKRKVRTTLLIIFMVCFVIMSVRLIFKIY